MTGQAHRVTEISHIADRRRVDGRAIWSPVSWVYRTHRVGMAAAVWICCSKRRAYHPQQRTATGERVLGYRFVRAQLTDFSSIGKVDVARVQTPSSATERKQTVRFMVEALQLLVATTRVS